MSYLSPDRRAASARTFLNARRRAALREASYLCSLLATAGVLYGLLVFLPGKMQTRELSQARDKLVQDVSVLRESMQVAQRDTKALENDAWYVERALRVRLGYLRPGERVFRAGR